MSQPPPSEPFGPPEGGVPNRLMLAGRIHQLMLRELGQGIEVERLLTQDRYARDVLLVCDALRGSDLALLASEFRRASRAVMGPLAPPGHVVQATDWDGDTSGFGPVSRPPPAMAAGHRPSEASDGLESAYPHHQPPQPGQPGQAEAADGLPASAPTERRRGWLTWRKR